MMDDDLLVWLSKQFDLDVAAAADVERIGLDTLIPAAIIDRSGATVYFAPDVYTRVCAVLNPDRVRREVEAKRLTVQLALCLDYGTDEGDLLRMLALPYSDRPGYREEEWKP